MRKCVILLAGLLLMLLAAGCNPPEDEGDGGNGETSAAGDPILLGFNLEKTGNAATFGISCEEGARIAIDELNDGGGILGRQIDPIFDDNASKSDEAVKVASKLISQDKVHVVIGAVASSNSIAMAAVAEETGVPMVTPASTNPSVTVDDDGSVRDYVFRTCFTDDFQGERIADYAVTGLGARNAVIFYDADNDYSVGIWETIKRVAPSKGLNIAAEDSYLSTNEQDFRAKLNKFKAYEFDVLIVPGYYNQVAMIANQARELGIDQPFLGGDGFDSPDLWKNAGENIEGSYYTNHYASDDMDPAVQNFITKYKQSHGGNVPDAMAILGYDAVMVVAEAIRIAGSTDPDEIAAGLEQVRDFQAATGKITINEQHNAQKKLVVIRIGEGGKLNWVYTYEPGGGEVDPTAAAGEGGEMAGEMNGDAMDGGDEMENPCGDATEGGDEGENPCNPCGDAENPCDH
jgi:branched-chain amino acid transport system substrate-binding protein